MCDKHFKALCRMDSSVAVGIGHGIITTYFRLASTMNPDTEQSSHG